jgi:outer membrane cobalamin receptor
MWPQISSGLDNLYLYSNPNLEPETLTMYEVGAKFNVGDKTSATVSIYQNDVENMIGQLTCEAKPGHSSGNAQNTPLMWENIGKARIQGFEAEMNHRFDDHYSAFVSYTYADSEIREYKEAGYAGNHLEVVPEHEFKFGLNWQKAKWTTNLLGRYTSEVYEDAENASSTDAVFLADMKIGYAFDDKQSVSLAIDNLLDREYESRGYLGNGRATYLEYSYQF